MGISSFLANRKYKNNRPVYYVRAILRELLPDFFCRIQLKSKLKKQTDFDIEYIQRRVNYYCKLQNCKPPFNFQVQLSEFKIPARIRAYYFDSYEYTRFFSKNRRATFLPGDITHVPDFPTIVKSRPIGNHNANSVILNLDKIRHFIFVNDKRSFISKKDLLVGRGAVTQSHRKRFQELYFNHPLCNIGQVNMDNEGNKYLVEKMTIDEQLEYKFILSLEGNDVATNLKWIMSSNSLAVMPCPKYETWFMEGTLVANYHYVMIEDDYSDLEERLNYYIGHPEEALEIVRNANEYTNQFRNKNREDVISLLVLDKYFRETGQY
ncbi:LpsA protein [Aquipluma nitroreducens]|uniref:LpsA protein n=1 Tax=Aquipluma nitroreducens TaxID=2010828 RepID=A0A5K7S8L8_9BACT|nr:glycosyl transferase family 90 [Aquipluma nitroreducens]BBE17902.1 LpsA protein [Aquipluma nitroreducens]